MDNMMGFVYLIALGVDDNLYDALCWARNESGCNTEVRALSYKSPFVVNPEGIVEFLEKYVLLGGWKIK